MKRVLKKKMDEMIESITRMTIDDVKHDFVKGNTEVIDIKKNKVAIPDGFKVTSDSTTVQKGIVIEDRDGNQFVWVPIGDVILDDDSVINIVLGRYIFNSLGEETLYANPEDLINDGYLELKETEEGVTTEGNVPARDIDEFIAKTKTYGGYWFGRYEASYRSGNDASDYKPYIKGQETVWNSITQSNDAHASRNMYSNSNFYSDLVNSYAWDTAIYYIQKCSTETKYSRKSSVNGRTEGILKTGTSTDKVCNIYDISSNICEWTTESSSYEWMNNGTVFRGGEFYRPQAYSSYRADWPVVVDYSVGFRTIIYLN